MKFTVLGARGTVGRALIEALRADGRAVRALARGDDWDYAADWGHAIYAIGVTADFRAKPFETVEAHVALLSEVLQRARFESLLYLSSTRIYLGADSTVETGVLRVSPTESADLYNLSKLLGEALCLSQRDRPVRVARLSNVVGGQDEDSQNFIPALRREARSGCIHLQTALTSTKDYIHIDDVVTLLPRLAESGKERIYNVASGAPIAHSEWVERLRQLTGCRVAVAADAPEVRFPVIDVRRLYTEFPHQLRSPLTALDA